MPEDQNDPQIVRAIPPPRRSRRGVALIIVLGFLVLITVLIVAYFASVTTETAATKSYASGANAKLLADTAVNVVMGQIAQGTRGQVAGSATRLTWASQPGMIRTYDDTGASTSCYKLYSAQHMVIAGDPGTVQSEMTNDVPTGWNNAPAIFTDINAPVADSSGALNFPILTGSGLARIFIASTGSNEYTYHTGLGSTPDIEGFYVNPPTSYQSTAIVSGTNNPVAMPVQWLYTLQDGTIISPDAGSSGTAATFQNAIQSLSATEQTLIKSGSNPIVGRIAFWTDDESCKLNINTASEGTDYSFTRINSPTEMNSTAKPSFGYAIAPPATGEYNRYPGHPATTCLSVALGVWLNNPTINTTGQPIAPTAYSQANFDTAYLGQISSGTSYTLPPLSVSGTGLAAYLLLSPRNQIGGSMAGTVSVSSSQAIVASDSDRLYTSLDELAFRAPALGDTTARTPFPNPKLTKTVLEKLKFFLTASSRAPELTPFNTPKMSLWPQWFSQTDRTTYQNPTEQLLAFCSSFGPPGVTGTATPSGKFEYFFERHNAGNWNGHPPSFYSSVLDWNAVPRNQQLANYLYNLGLKKIPGYGAQFLGKYDQNALTSIIVESLDYIRSDIGAMDYVVQSIGPEQPIYPLVVSSTASQYGFPAVSGTFKGFGHFPLITQVCIGEALEQAGTNNELIPFMVFNLFNPTKAFPGSNVSYGSLISMAPMENFGLNPYPGSTKISGTFTVGGLWEWKDNKNETMQGIGVTLSGSCDTTQPNVTLGTGNPVIMTLKDVDSPQNIFQQVQLTFPQTGPIPKPTQFANSPGNWYAASGGLIGAMGNLGVQGSVMRSLECGANTPLKGDWRLMGLYVNANQIAGQNIFTPTKYYQSSFLQEHTLRLEDRTDSWMQEPTYAHNVGWPPSTSMAGSLTSLLANTDYLDDQAPCVPAGLTAATMLGTTPGDWDTGPGLECDGPYINPVEQNYTVGTSEFFSQDTFSIGGNNPFVPNRIVSSAVRFGSLPTGFSLTNPTPWQTLLFCPNPAGRTTPASGIPTATEHIGFKNPPDHLYLEFYTMPVVQPYAISEPLSTAGKVNLNYQLAPFTYIERSTALRGVLKSTLMSGICGLDVKGSGIHPTPSSDVPSYKFSGAATAGEANETRYSINRDATISGIEEHYFNQGKLFMYPSQICDVFLVPLKLPSGRYNLGAAVPPTSYDDMESWWAPKDLTTMSLTGDNLREEPYDKLYPRLTTKSNTFTVHYRVQVLQKRAASTPTEWDEGQDQIVSENRGSSLIERYVDPNDPAINSQWDKDTLALNVDATATPAGTADLSRLYKFRVISTKKFAP